MADLIINITSEALTSLYVIAFVTGLANTFKENPALLKTTFITQRRTSNIVIYLGISWWWSGFALQLYISMILQVKIAMEGHWSIIVYHMKRVYDQNRGRFF